MAGLVPPLPAAPAAGADRRFFVGLARAFAGALIFALPMVMTMELWWLGFYMNPWKLSLLVALAVPLLTGLSYYSGFKETTGLRDDMVDAFVAFAVALVMAMVLLFLLGIITVAMAPHEVVGKVALQAVPASIGAMLARSQMSGQKSPSLEDRRRHISYHGELFLMAVGALFLSLNVAPTQEMVLIAYKMGAWQQVTLALLSIALMHAFVYGMDFRGEPDPLGDMRFWSLFLRFTVTGYALVFLVSLYLLWTFGRTEGTSLEEILSAAVVLAFPGAIGAAAARLII